MSSSRNEAGIAIVSTETGKRTTLNSRGLRRQLFSDETEALVPHENTSSKPKKHWSNTCFGRFSTTNRQEELMAGSPHSAEKLKRLGIDLRSNTVAEGETKDECGATPSSPRQTRDILRLEIDGSPVRIQMKRLPPSPDARSYYPNPKQPSPGTISRAQRIEAPQNAEKFCVADIRLTSLKKGKKTSRAIPHSAFNGVSAQILNTLYSNIEHIRIRKEYLHGIDKASGGEANQQNLFVASRDANSQMIPLDEFKKQLVEEGLCEQVHSVVKSTLQTKADGSELTHISKEIEIAHYVDNTGLKVSAVIDANTTERPSVQERKMIIDFLIIVQKSLLAQQAPTPITPPVDTLGSTEALEPCEDPSLTDSGAATFDSLLYHFMDANEASSSNLLSDAVASHSDEYPLYSVDDPLVLESLPEGMFSNDDPLDSSIDIDSSPDCLQESTVLITLHLEHSELLEEFSSYQDLLCCSAEFSFEEDSLLDPADTGYTHESLYSSVDSQHPTEAELAKKSRPFEPFPDEVNENVCPNLPSCSFFGKSSPVKKMAKITYEPDKSYQAPSI